MENVRVRKYATVWICCLAASIAPSPVRAQSAATGITGRLTGRVIDAKTGAGLPDAGVHINGTTSGANSGVDGRFSVTVTAGEQLSLTVRRIGFAPKTVTGIAVVAGRVTEQNVVLSATATRLTEQVVTASRENGSVAAALDAQRTAVGIINSTTAEQIEQSPDRNAAQAVRRVSGVTVQDDKYIFVRGLGERYTTASLNGARLPSPEPDRKVVPLDLFPASLVQSITTSKTFTPDRPGDFSGASVDIRTREFPTEPVTTITVSAGMNSAATGRSVLAAPTVGQEWLGLPGSTRKLPAIVSSAGKLQSLSTTQASDIVKSFRNVWAPLSRNGDPNSSLGISRGGQAPLLGQSLGYMLSGTYGYSQEVRANEVRARALANGPDRQTTVNEATGSTGRTSVTLGGLANFSLLAGSRTRLQFNNMYNRTADNEAHSDSGFFLIRIEDPARRSTLSFVERSVRSNQISGEHTLNSRSLLDWSLTLAGVTRKEPDRVDVAYVQRLQEGPNTPFALDLSDADGARRTFSDLRETTTEFSTNYRYGLDANARAFVKFGGALRSTNRDASQVPYSIQSFSLTTSDAAKPADQIITQYADVPGALIPVSNVFGGLYTAREVVSAGYAMLDIPFGDRFQLVTGARVENWDLNLVTQPIVTTDVTRSHPTTTDILPSLALNVKLTDRQNLRFSAGRTVSRPEYREISQLASTDLIGDVTTFGNPNLQRALIENYDIRWETYPSAGEIFSIAVYGKVFHDPIEKIEVASTGASSYTYVNTERATNIGMELEARHGLGFIASPMRAFSIFANATVIQSRIVIGNSDIASTRSDARPMVGQAPYVLNTGIGWSLGRASADAFYNLVGKRIAVAGNSDLPDTYELPRNSVDFSLRIPVLQNVAARFDARNLLDAPYEQRQGSVTRLRYTTGRVFSLGLSMQPFSADRKNR
jgi:hypothetical protein